MGKVGLVARHQTPEMGAGDAGVFIDESATQITPDVEPRQDAEIAVEQRRILSQRRYRDIGQIIKYEVKLADGTAYREQRCMPNEQRYDRGVTITTPWCTRIPGFNTDLQKQLAAEGIASDIVGPPRPVIDRNTLRNIPNAVRLETDAAVQQQLFTNAAEDGMFKSDEALATGYSRGAMMIWGLTANEQDYGRNIRYFDANDPCLVRKVRIGDVDPREGRTYTYVPREIMAAFSAIGKHSIEEMLHLPQSIDVSPRGILENVATGFALFKGQAGELLKRVPRDKVGTVRLYERSMFNHAEELYDVLNDHPHITIYDRRGYHLSGMSPRVRMAAVKRIVTAQEALANDHPLEQIDFTMPYSDQQ